MRKILCSNSKYERVFAHLLDDGTIDIMRQDQRFTIIPSDGSAFTLIGTNPQGHGKTVIMVKDGKIVEDSVKFKEDKKDEPKEDSHGDGQERSEETGQPGDPASGDPGTDPDPDTGDGGDGIGDPPADPDGGEPAATERKYTVAKPVVTR